MVRSFRLVFATAAILIIAFAASAQTNSVSIGTTNTNPSAVLWLKSANGNQGLIIPVGSRTSVANPVAGMIIFDSNQVYAYDGTNWNPVGGSGGGSIPVLTATQVLTGNGTTNSAIGLS